MSLCSRRVACLRENKAAAVAASASKTLQAHGVPFPSEVSDTPECPQSRVEFHKTLSLLVRMGVAGDISERCTRRNVSIFEIEEIWVSLTIGIVTSCLFNQRVIYLDEFCDITI